MTSLFVLGVFWSIYGCLGLFALQVIPDKYKGTKYEKKYKRFSGVSKILLGLPWLIVYFITRNMDLPIILMVMILVISSIPSLVFSFVGERQYSDLLD